MKSPVTRISVPEELAGTTPTASTIGVGDGLLGHEVVNLALDFRLNQLVQKSHPELDLEFLASEQMILKPDLFFKLPASSILDANACNEAREQELTLMRAAFTKAVEKPQILADLQSVLTQRKIPQTLQHDISLAADEMFTNAIFNAPFVNFAKNGPGAPRTPQDVAKAVARPAKMFLATNGQRYVLGCEDSYGTLNPKRLLERLRQCFNEGTSKAMNWESGGAGIGIFMVFQSALAFYIAVEESKRTLVCCTFWHTPRKIKDGSKNLHIFLNK